MNDTVATWTCANGDLSKESEDIRFRRYLSNKGIVGYSMHRDVRYDERYGVMVTRGPTEWVVRYNKDPFADFC